VKVVIKIVSILGWYKSFVTSNGVTKFTYITGGVGVGKTHSSRGFKKQKICSCRKDLVYFKKNQINTLLKLCYKVENVIPGW